MASLLKTSPEAQEACSRSLCVNRLPQEEGRYSCLDAEGDGDVSGHFGLNQERMGYYFT